MPTRTFCPLFLSLIATILLPSGSAQGQGGLPCQSKIIASDAAREARFGTSVSVSGTTAIVGAHLHDLPRFNAGAAYIYVQEDGAWVEERMLNPIDDRQGDFFGSAVSISGDLAAVGARGKDEAGDNSNSGAAYIFTRNNGFWPEQAKLAPSDPQPFAEFGSSISIDGDTVVVGSPEASNNDPNGFSGAAYVFVQSGSSWNEQARLTASDSEPFDDFGEAVSISNNTIVVGTPSDDDNGPNTGAAYVFVRNGNQWTEQAKLTASDMASQMNFGHSVAVLGERIVVGARPIDGIGAVYIFERVSGIWNEEEKLTPSDGVLDDFFGTSVSLSGNKIVVGASGRDDAGTGSGAVYLYRKSEGIWTERGKFIGTDTDMNDSLGGSVAVSGSTLIAGAVGDTPRGLLSGSTYIFRIGNSGSGSVNSGAGSTTDVLFLNGSAGDENRTVTLSTGESITVALDPAPAGSMEGSYVLWLWAGFPGTCTEITASGQSLGHTLNPTPLHPFQSPQPFRCLRGSGLPAFVCGGAREFGAAPKAVPWIATRSSGLNTPAVIFLQGIVKDLGASNSLDFSVTNGIVLDVQ